MVFSKRGSASAVAATGNGCLQQQQLQQQQQQQQGDLESVPLKENYAKKCVKNDEGRRTEPTRLQEVEDSAAEPPLLTSNKSHGHQRHHHQQKSADSAGHSCCGGGGGGYGYSNFLARRSVLERWLLAWLVLSAASMLALVTALAELRAKGSHKTTEYSKAASAAERLYIQDLSKSAGVSWEVAHTHVIRRRLANEVVDVARAHYRHYSLECHFAGCAHCLPASHCLSSFFHALLTIFLSS